MNRHISNILQNTPAEPLNPYADELGTQTRLCLELFNMRFSIYVARSAMRLSMINSSIFSRTFRAAGFSFEIF